MKFLKSLFFILIDISLNLYFKFERMFEFSSLAMEIFVFSSVTMERYMTNIFLFLWVFNIFKVTFYKLLCNFGLKFFVASINVSLSMN